MASATPPPRNPRRSVGLGGGGTASSTRSVTPAATKEPAPALVAKGVGPRTTSSPKATPPARRPASSRPSSSLGTPSKLKENGISSEPLVSKTPERSETEDAARDELRLRIQDLDSTVSNLVSENSALQSSLSQAESRLAELYADQARTDEELGVRHELAEKFRAQLREFEKEKRDLTRRYKEQTAAFEAERQSFYDNEQHLKSRIQALSQSRKENHTPRRPRRSEFDETASIVSEAEYPPSTPGPSEHSKDFHQVQGDDQDASENQEEGDDNEPAEMTALKLELSTLSTSYTSIQSTLHLLQSQLLDLQRVNAELQEENEGWKVLVQQRTLAGTFDVLTLGGASRTPEPEGEPALGTDDASIKGSRVNTLDKVLEMDEIHYEAEVKGQSLQNELERHSSDFTRKPRSITNRSDIDLELFSDSPVREGSPASRRSRRRGGGPSSVDESSKVETLADLPITGPGLDLAAELGRAQTADGFIPEKSSSSGPKKSQAQAGVDFQTKLELEALKTEVKSLKEANKALSLYASKIVDRIIATEGFENVLAVDFQEKQPNSKGGGLGKIFASAPKPRPTSIIFGRGTPNPEGTPVTAVPKEKLTTFESIGLSSSISAQPNKNPSGASLQRSKSTNDDPRRSRRSMSFDWRGFSLFGGGQSEAEKKADPILRPLTLRPGASSLGTSSSTSIPTARKLDTTEDEEDRKERERLRATMRLMGIDPEKEVAAMKQPASDVNQGPNANGDANAAEPKFRPLSTGGTVVSIGTPPTSRPPSPKTVTSKRFSWFGLRNEDGTSTSSSSLMENSGSSSQAPLTAEALQQAEAESHLAALDAKEKAIKEEIAKGSGSGFTELSGLNGGPGRRRIGEEWRSRRSASINGTDLRRTRSVRKEGSSAGSASTVWSAGKDDE